MMGWMLLYVHHCISHLLYLFLTEEENFDSKQVNDIQVQHSQLECVKAEIEKKGPLQ